MKRTLAVLLTLILAVGLVAAQDAMKSKKPKAEAKETTVKGEVVDVSCYLHKGDGATGADHQACAEACAKAGGPLGILTKDKKLYVSVMPDDHSAGPNAKLMEHIGHQVEVTGMVRSKSGVNGIMITNVAMAAAPEEKK